MAATFCPAAKAVDGSDLQFGLIDFGLCAGCDAEAVELRGDPRHWPAARWQELTTVHSGGTFQLSCNLWRRSLFSFIASPIIILGCRTPENRLCLVVFWLAGSALSSDQPCLNLGVTYD